MFIHDQLFSNTDFLWMQNEMWDVMCNKYFDTVWMYDVSIHDFSFAYLAA